MRLDPAASRNDDTHAWCPASASCSSSTACATSTTRRYVPIFRCENPQRPPTADSGRRWRPSSRRHAPATARRRATSTAPPRPTATTSPRHHPAVIDTAPPDIRPLTVGSLRSDVRAACRRGAGGGRPWLLVGTGRADAGEPARLTVLSSPDGRSWSALDRGDAGDHTAAAAAYGRADGSLVIAGAVDGAGGSQPAVWELRDGELAAPAGASKVSFGAATAARTRRPGRAGAPARHAGWAGGGEHGRRRVVDGAAARRRRRDRHRRQRVVGRRHGHVDLALDRRRPIVRGDAGRAGASAPSRRRPAGSSPRRARPAVRVLSPDGARRGPTSPRCTPAVSCRSPGGGCGTIAPDDEGGVWLASAAGEPGGVPRARAGRRPARRTGAAAGYDLRRAATGGGRRGRRSSSPCRSPVAWRRRPRRSVTLPTDLELDAAMTATIGRAARPRCPRRRRTARRPRCGRRCRHVPDRRRRHRRLVPLDDHAGGGRRRRGGPRSCADAGRTRRTRRQPRRHRAHRDG